MTPLGIETNTTTKGYSPFTIFGGFTRGEVLRWASIDSVADRLGMDPDKAAALAAELGEAGLVRVGGGHSVWLTEAGRQAC